jgi:hypothetical protein
VHDDRAVSLTGKRPNKMTRTGGTLWVPFTRAEENGLRPPVNSLAPIMAELHAEVRPLPENGRQRMSELNVRWLARAVERLSVEASLLDAADVATAAAQIWHELGISA